MPKKDIIKLKSAPRLEQVGDNCPKQMEHRNHRVDDELILLHRANRPDGIFGSDNRLARPPRPFRKKNLAKRTAATRSKARPGFAAAPRARKTHKAGGSAPIQRNTVRI
jgi:hypothetical protein